MRNLRKSQFIHLIAIVTFMASLVLPPAASAQGFGVDAFAPSVRMVTTSPDYAPQLMVGLNIHPKDPFQFDFFVNTGDGDLAGNALRDESLKLIRYFMASLTIPEEKMWVNLSPYEKDRIIDERFAQTEMGRDLLAQDYLLKQLTASLMYPENKLGEEFWEQVRARIIEEYGVNEIPVNAFSKVWIIPDKATVYVNGTRAFITESHLKVMLEDDYIALEKSLGINEYGLDSVGQSETQAMNEMTNTIFKEVIIPALQREVNQGAHFAPLRQIFHSMILATWYKKNFRESILGQVYVDQNKIAGVDIEDKDVKQKIYNRYVEAFEKGLYDIIQEEYNPITQEIIPRKYFSGGVGLDKTNVIDAVALSDEAAQHLSRGRVIEISSGFDRAMITATDAEIEQERVLAAQVFDFYDSFGDDLVDSILNSEEGVVIHAAFLKLMDLKQQFNSRGYYLGLGDRLGDFIIDYMSTHLKPVIEQQLAEIGVEVKIYSTGPNIYLTFKSPANVPDVERAIQKALEKIFAPLSPFKTRMFTQAQREFEFNDELAANLLIDDGFNQESLQIYAGLSSGYSRDSGDLSFEEAVAIADGLNVEAFKAAKIAQLGLSARWQKYVADDGRRPQSINGMMEAVFDQVKQPSQSGIRAYDKQTVKEIGFVNRINYNHVFDMGSIADKNLGEDLSYNRFLQLHQSALEQGDIELAKNILEEFVRSRIYGRNGFNGNRGKDHFNILINRILREGSTPQMHNENLTADFHGTFRLGGRSDELGAVIWDVDPQTQRGKIAIFRFDGNNVGSIIAEPRYDPEDGSKIDPEQVAQELIYGSVETIDKVIAESAQDGRAFEERLEHITQNLQPRIQEKFAHSVFEETRVPLSITESRKFIRVQQGLEERHYVHLVKQDGTSTETIILDGRGNVVEGSAELITVRSVDEGFGLSVKSAKEDYKFLTISAEDYLSLRESGEVDISNEFIIYREVNPMIAGGYVVVDFHRPLRGSDREREDDELNDFDRDFSLIQGRADTISGEVKREMRSSEIMGNEEFPGGIIKAAQPFSFQDVISFSKVHEYTDMHWFIADVIISEMAKHSPEHTSDVADAAQASAEEYGGINLNPNNLFLKTQGRPARFELPGNALEYNRAPINGLQPVIFDIKPVDDIMFLLKNESDLIREQAVLL